MRDVWVFINADDCAFGVAESAYFPTADDAWNEMYVTPSEQQAARDRGVKVYRTSYRAYHNHHRKCMRRQCNHHPQPVS